MKTAASTAVATAPQVQPAAYANSSRPCSILSSVFAGSALSTDEDFAAALCAELPALIAAEEAEQSKTVQEAEGHHIAQASHGGIAAVGEHINIYAGSAPLQSTPATPPAPPAHFTGRRHQLEQLKAATHGNQAAALYGMVGIGKTATAQLLAAGRMFISNRNPTGKM